jgi:hypothetical protein
MSWIQLRLLSVAFAILLGLAAFGLGVFLNSFDQQNSEHHVEGTHLPERLAADAH